MKPHLFGLSLLLLSPLAHAQPQAANPFALLSDAPVAARSQKVSLAQLAAGRQMALLSLRAPLNGAKQVLVAAWGRDAVLVSVEGAFSLLPIKELAALYGGEALVPTVPAPALAVDDAVQIVPITALGDDAQVVAHYALRNTGRVPLDLAVVSTSCGCTAAKLDKSRLLAGESTTLTATMHADSERLVRVTLQAGDAVAGRMVLALQSKPTFAPFQVPAPLSLFGEKGQTLSAQSDFELPVGWKVARVVASPAWLQTRLQSQVAAPPVADAKSPALPRFSLDVTAPASAPEGPLAGSVLLELVGAPLRSLSVPVGGFISNDISASPRMVVLDKSPLGTARRVVVVHGPRPFSIRGITSQMKGFTAHFAPNIEARAHAIELLIPVAGKKDDSFFERANVELSDGRELPLDMAGTIGEGTLPVLAQGVTLNAPAPACVGMNTQGKTVSLADFRGRSNVLLTFFPHCFTGGCESHLASLRAAYPALQASGTQVIAVSTDDVAKVRAFAEQLHLPFPVLNDTNRRVALAWGAVQSQTDAPSRLSFLIDKAGVVRWIDTDVHVQTHGADVLAKIKELGLDK